MSLYPVQFFGKFFESRIFDAHVKQYERLLNSVPTVVLYSQMTDENLYLHIYGWGFGDITLTETCTFNWEAVYEQFHKKGASDKEAYKAIRKMIVALHQAFAAFCSDFYYLTMINPLHEPRLLNAVFSEELQMVVEPLKQSLQTICEKNRQRYEQELLTIQQQECELELQRQRELEEKQRQEREWETLGKFKVCSIDGIAKDEQTNLMWLRFSYGQTWENGTAVGDAQGMNCHDAIEIADTFNAKGGYAGFTDWRLPNIEELKALVDINKDVFPNSRLGSFWSCSPDAFHRGHARVMDFGSRCTNSGRMYDNSAVRLVRGG